MPEGDTIWRAAAALRERFGGARVVAAEPQPLHRLAGRTLRGVEATGKHLTLHFDRGPALHTHMRMTGSWHIYSTGQRWRKPVWQATAVIRFPSGVAVLFSAPVCELVASERQATAHLGPDILDPATDLDAVVERAQLAGRPTLAEVLLDQGVCAGIGNIHKCEALHVLGLSPWTSPADVDAETVRRLYATARDRMRRAVIGGAFRPRTAVHGRAGRPCPRCATPVAVRSQGEQARLTFWCPRCQPASAGTGDRNRGG